MWRKLFQAEVGMGLVEVMVAASMLGGLSLVVMKLNESGVKTVAMTENRMEIVDFDRELNTYFSDKTACTYTMIPPISSTSLASGISRTVIKNAANTTVVNLSTGTNIQRGKVKLIGLKLKGYDATTNTANLEKTFQYKLSPTNIVERTTVKKIALEMSGSNAVECVLKAAEAAGPWVISDYGIYYPASTVAIGKVPHNQSSLRFQVDGQSIIGGTANSIFSTTNNNIIGGGWNSIWAGAINTVIVGGLNHNVSSSNWGTFVGGRYHTAGGYNGTVVGGRSGNIIQTNDGVILGGVSNSLASNWGNVIGGSYNYVGTHYSSIFGGEQNSVKISGSTYNYSSDNIFGGSNNKITGDGSSNPRSTILGGYNNYTFNAVNSVIIGGKDNSNFSPESSGILAGRLNRISSSESAVVGGIGNTISQPSSGILGGEVLLIESPKSVILGGTWHSITGTGESNAFLAGGGSWMSGSTYSVVAGGVWNKSIGSFGSTILGGILNYDAGSYNSIVGGVFNINDGSYNVIAGGSNNTINSIQESSVVLGGEGNNLAGSNSSQSGILAGWRNEIAGTNNAYRSTIIGGEANTIDAGPINNIIGSVSSRITGANNYRNTIVGGLFNTIGRGIHNVILGGEHNFMDSTGDNNAMLGGTDNVIRTVFYSTIIGGYGNSIGENGFNSNAIISSVNSRIKSAHRGVILGGDSNTLESYGGGIYGSKYSIISTFADRSIILGGYNHTIYGDSLQGSAASVIIGGDQCKIDGALNSIIMASDLSQFVRNATTQVTRSVIMGGDNNSIAANRGGIYNCSNCFIQSGHIGSVMMGDNNGGTGVTSSSAGDQLTLRFAGGMRLCLNNTCTSGYQLTSGNVWGAIPAPSSKTLKKDFKKINDEEVLSKFEKLEIPSWFYKVQNHSKRTIGPMAEDFSQMFAVPYDLSSTPKEIHQSDINGITLLSIKALEKRTSDLAQENIELKEEINSLKNEMAEIKKLLREKNKNK